MRKLGFEWPATPCSTHLKNSSLCWLLLQRENRVWPSIDSVRDVLWLLRHVGVLRALENLARGEQVKCLVASVA